MPVVTAVKLVSYVLAFFLIWYGHKVVIGVNPYGEEIWMGWLKIALGAIIIYTNFFHVPKRFGGL